jgi:hypothetical protein
MTTDTTRCATDRCAACTTHAGEHLSRHVVSNGWITYYRCMACKGVSAVHTPRITWGT